MLNLLKSDLYRLVHGKMLWVGLAALLVVVVGAAGLIWFATTPYFAEMVMEQAANAEAAVDAGSAWNMQLTTSNNAGLDAAEVEALNEKVINSRTYSYGSTFMVGFLGLIVSVLAALIAASDFDSGFAKSVLAGRRNRLPYFGEKLLLIALVCGAFLLVAMVATDAAYLLLGFTYEHVETVGEYWAWTGLAWLEMTAYAYVVALIVWATRSKAAGIVFAALIPSGFLESMLLTAAVGLAPAFPLVNDVAKWLPLSTQQLLSAGGTQVFAAGDAAAVAGMPVAWQVLIVFGVLATVCAVLALAACPRKDVA